MKIFLSAAQATAPSPDSFAICSDPAEKGVNQPLCGSVTDAPGLSRQTDRSAALLGLCTPCHQHIKRIMIPALAVGTRPINSYFSSLISPASTTSHFDADSSCEQTPHCPSGPDTTFVHTSLWHMDFSFKK